MGKSSKKSATKVSSFFVFRFIQYITKKKKKITSFCKASLFFGFVFRLLLLLLLLGFDISSFYRLIQLLLLFFLRQSLPRKVPSLFINFSILFCGLYLVVFNSRGYMVFFCVYFYLLNFNAFYVPCVVIELVDLVSNSEVIDLLFCLGDDFGVFFLHLKKKNLH